MNPCTVCGGTGHILVPHPLLGYLRPMSCGCRFNLPGSVAYSDDGLNVITSPMNHGPVATARPLREPYMDAATRADVAATADRLQDQVDSWLTAAPVDPSTNVGVAASYGAWVGQQLVGGDPPPSLGHVVTPCFVISPPPPEEVQAKIRQLLRLNGAINL